MSFANLLGTKKVDKGLDDIFKSSAGPSTLASTKTTSGQRPTHDDNKSKTSNIKKRKSEKEQIEPGKFSKKPRTTTPSTISNTSDSPKNSKSEGKKKAILDPNEDGVVDSSNSEGRAEVVTVQVETEENSDSDSGDEIPQHETLVNSGKSRRTTAGQGERKKKYVPEGETKEQRDARTVFIGNVPVKVVNNKSLTKKLKQHILSFVPEAIIESIRFRSVAFLNPTSSLGDDNDTSGKSKPNPSSSPDKHKHSQKRAAEWRDLQQSKAEEEESAEIKKGLKQYLSPSQKRRLAAIKGDVHEHPAATANAYVVFGYPVPLVSNASPAKDAPVKAGASVTSRKDMDPFEAAKATVLKVDGTEFEEHTLRADLVGAGSENGKTTSISSLTDPKMSIFVGNLDFACTEDDVRAFFEKVMCEERGGAPPNLSSNSKLVEVSVEDGDEVEGEEGDGKEGRGDKEDDKSESADSADEKSLKVQPLSQKAPTWVARVRIIRDRATQLGKGFAYVQFIDRDCVDEILALEPEKLKFARRTLRVSRCKTVQTRNNQKSQQQKQASSARKAPAGMTSTPRTKGPAPSTSAIAAVAAAKAIEIPKGDPSLGKRLEGLDKLSRKEAKASDATRVARRLAKKKARAALHKAGVTESRGKGKERIRERKDKGKKVVNSGRKEGKKRVRSGRNLDRRNVKK